MIKLIRHLFSFAFKKELVDSAFIDYLQVSPNPRLHLFVKTWHPGNELTIRGAMNKVMAERPNAGFELK